MKRTFNKSIAFCLIMVMTSIFCIGCSAAAAKAEPLQPEVVNNVSIVNENDKISSQKAISLYADLLKASPTIINNNSEILDDLSFGYEDNLAKYGMHYDYFAVLDLNDDGIPELITSTIINNRWTPVSVFQYNESANELQLLKDPLDPESHATFEQMSTAAGIYSLYICKDNHLHSNWSGDTPVGFQEENHAYVFNDDCLASVDCSISNNTENDSDISVNFWDVFNINDEEAINAFLVPLMK